MHIIESFCPGFCTGAGRYFQFDWLRQDQTLAAIFGYDSMPSQCAYSRFFGKLLFEVLANYHFSLHLANLDLPLDQIRNIYNSRADCEPSAAR